MDPVQPPCGNANEITTLQNNDDPIELLSSEGLNEINREQMEPVQPSSGNANKFTTLPNNDSLIGRFGLLNEEDANRVATLLNIESVSEEDANEIATILNNESVMGPLTAGAHNQTTRREGYYTLYLKFTKTLSGNDWKGLEDDINSYDTEALTTVSWEGSFTIFHLIISSAAPTRLLEKFASMVTPEWLQRTDGIIDSPIFSAVVSKVNNVKILVERNNDLPNTRKRGGRRSLPIHEAAFFGKKEIVQYLREKTTLDDADGFLLVENLISSNVLADVALDVLKKNPRIARGRPREILKILRLLAKRPDAFASGSRLGYWEHLLYQRIPVEEEYNPHPHHENVVRDPENPVATSNIPLIFLFQQITGAFGSLRQKLKIMLWNTLMQLAPGIKSIRDQKIKHTKTHEIVRIVCTKGADTWNTPFAARMALEEPMFTAARWGIHEIVNEIISSCYTLILSENEERRDIIGIAVQYRQEKVFNIIYKYSKWKETVACLDAKADNMLHLAGKLVPSSEVPGPALQMQRELQWFQAVKNILQPNIQAQLDEDNKTPREVFTEAHKPLVQEGGKWMKETAQSCSVVGALMITVAFSAAFTVPGGSDGRGMPPLLHETSFIIFGISDALALFSSTCSVLMFLGILTSRYSEEDFLKSLPTKLIVGLMTLFFSIASMMVAFAARVNLVVFHPWKWAIIPVGLLGFLPVTLFVALQFPLLVEMYSSTYGPGIFQPDN